MLKDSSSTMFCDYREPGYERTARGSDITPPFIVYRWISKFAFSIIVESDDMNPPTDLRVRSSIAREGRIASSCQGVVLPEDCSGGGLQHWRMCDENAMGNFQGRGLQKTSVLFLVTREAAPI